MLTMAEFGLIDLAALSTACGQEMFCSAVKIYVLKQTQDLKLLVTSEYSNSENVESFQRKLYTGPEVFIVILARFSKFPFFVMLIRWPITSN